MTDHVHEIRKLLKNINNDDEIDEIHEHLDMLDGSYVSNNPRVTGVAAKAAKHGFVERVDIMHEYDTTPVVGGSVNFTDRGVVRVDVSIVAGADDVYGD